MMTAKEIHPMTESFSATVKTADRKAEKHIPVSARFRVSLAVSGTLHATANCNLHGLWTSAFPIVVS